MSVAAGMIYVGAILYGSQRLSFTPGRRALMVIGLLALGSSQLWFGHVENYSLVTAFSMVATALALGYLAGKRPLWAAGLAAGAALSAHPQAIFTFPALLLLLAAPGDRRRWPRQILVLALSVAVVPLLTVIALRAAGVPWPGFASAWAGDGQVFWTPRQALTPSQLLDALNNLWLVAPALPLILVAGVGALTCGRRCEGIGASGTLSCLPPACWSTTSASRTSCPGRATGSVRHRRARRDAVGSVCLAAT